MRWASTQREGDRLLLGDGGGHGVERAIRTASRRWRARAGCRKLASATKTRDQRINALDAGGFWDCGRTGQDDLKWYSPPFYTFLKTAPKARGDC